MVTYQEVKNETGNVVAIRKSDGMFIPVSENNTDYIIYQNWLNGYEVIGGQLVKTSEGNTPLPADE